MTTTVYFDLDGTLLDYETPFDAWVERTLPDGTAATAAFGTRLTEALDAFAPNPYERAFESVCDEYGIDADPSALAASFVRTEVAATRLPPSVRELLGALADRHRVGVLTNGNGAVQRRKLESHGLDEVVDAVVVSEEVRAKKPSDEAFETARERLPADAYVFVGDSYETDVLPAEANGFAAVYVGDERRPEATIAAEDTAALASLLGPIVA